VGRVDNTSRRWVPFCGLTPPGCQEGRDRARPIEGRPPRSLRSFSSQDRRCGAKSLSSGSGAYEPPKAKFAPDSPLEGDGFEPSVPLYILTVSDPLLGPRDGPVRQTEITRSRPGTKRSTPASAAEYTGPPPGGSPLARYRGGVISTHRPMGTPRALSSVQVRYLTSATSSGRTQCTRVSTRGRAEAAGARSRNVERHFVGSKRVFNLANPAEMTRNRNFSPPDALAGADRRRARD
jgi:hypothetical protein